MNGPSAISIGAAGATLNFPADQLNVTAGASIGGTGTLVNQGAIKFNAPSASFGMSGVWNNSGTLLFSSGTANLNNATINNQSNGTMEFVGTTSVVNASGVNSISLAGTLKKTATGTSNVSVPVTISGNIDSQAGNLSFTSTVNQVAGTNSINGTLTAPSYALQGGTLKGSGTISSPLTAESGTVIAPGNSPGILSTGNFSLNSGATLQIEIGGLGANPGTDFDQVNVTGTVTLAGDLDVVRWSDFSFGQSYTIINNDGIDPVSGTFNGLSEGATVQIGDYGVFTISYVGGTGNDVVLTSSSGLRQVGSTADTGAGSLRQAILDSTSNAGPDIITFGFVGPGPHVITPATTLPVISTSTIIDATRLPGYSGSPIVELSGTSLGATGTGLNINGSGIAVEISGLAITGFGTHGISSGFASLTLRDNYIGLKPDGVTAAGNGLTDPFASTRAGVFQNGGEILLEDNVISGNDDGVLFTAGPIATLRRNKIGTNAAGTAAVGNVHGIYLDTTNGVVIGGNTGADGNLISGNTVGIAGSVFASNNIIIGNTIGLNLAGTATIPNATGVSIEGSSNRIGTNGDGTNDVFERNVISGNTANGVQIIGTSATGI